MKLTKYSLALLITVFTFQVKAQCFDIQSILVDACNGTQEGQNEMVTFKVGSTALNTANLSVNWPNNSWLGICQNAGTAADIAYVNTTIIGCGFLKEPVGGVLPANSKVLLITSTAWSTSAQSFVGLSDTLYVIFQCAGNTSGHFANYASGGGLRTLSMSFSIPVGCTDAVTYDRGLLVTQAGTAGGQDGATVEFTSGGVASYVNHGCQAPFIPLSVDAGPNKTICVSGSQTFTATTSGNYTSVQWSLGAGATGSFAPTNSLVTTYTAGAGDNGTIKLYCTISKSCGTQTATARDSVNLMITPLPTVTLSPVSASICPGQSVTLQANTNTAVTYTWSGTGVNGLHTNTVSVNTVGAYTVNTSNACGSASMAVNVVASSIPVISATASTPSICASGQTSVLSLSGSSGTYSWSNGASAASTTVSIPGVYIATVTTTGCGTATTSITIGTIPNASVSISLPSSTVCAGNSVVLTATSNTGNYLWTGGATTQTLSVNTTATVVVTSTNVCNVAQATQTVNVISLPTLTLTPAATMICPGQSVILQASASAAVTYTWSGTGVNGLHTNTVSVNAAGVYSVSVSNQCGTAGPATSTISVGTAAPTATIVSTATVLCPGQTATLSLTGSTGTYSWSAGTSTTSTLPIALPGVYSATVTNSCGSATSLITITSLPTPTVSISPSSVVLCPGTTGTLVATSNAGNFVWNTGATTNNLSSVTPGVYSVSVTNTCGTATVSVTVASVSIPSLIVTSSNYTICPNQTATLTVTGGSGNPVPVYNWSNSTSTGSVVTSNGGTITVTNTNVCGSSTASVVINVVALHAGIAANPLSGVKPLVVNFTNNSTGGVTYLWSFGNGNVATTQTVMPQTYASAGDYTASITVSNGVCTDQASVIIKVLNEEPGLIIPNVFTPNNDSRNDMFKVTGLNIAEFNCVVFDRWGLKLFSWNDINQGWDGKTNGNTCADGTYFYIILAKDLNDKEINKQGSFSLFR